MPGLLAQAEEQLDLTQRWRIAKARAQRTLARSASAHTDWMNECVPELMSYGKDQIVAVAACLNMWRDAWEEAHPDGADDPGPDRPQKTLQTARDTLARLFDESQHPRDERGRFTDADGGDHPGEGYSKDATIKDGVIHTSNVEDAALALHQDRAVELDQPRSVSVLLDKLGAVAKDMIAKGEKAPTFNLCKLTIKGTNLFCVDAHGIPRVQMPQIAIGDEPKFRQFLLDKGYTVTSEKQFASYLRATQNELNGGKVAAIAEDARNRPNHQAYPLFVSEDDYILDGHHRWGAKIGLDAADNILGNDTKMDIERVHISITALLEAAEEFTGGAGKVSLEDVERAKRWRRIKLEAQRTLARVLKFDPNQPRDEEGKWTDTGASSKPKDKKKGKATKSDFDKAKITIAGDKLKQDLFIESWNETIGEDPATFKSNFMGGLDGTMTISANTTGTMLELNGTVQSPQGHSLGEYKRKINIESKVADSSYFKLTQTRGSIGKKMLAGNIDTYEQLGIEKVRVFANLDVGGYAWAKYGYVPTKAAWDEMRGGLERRLSAGASGGSGIEADEWDALSSDQQEETYRRWQRDTYDEFRASEEQNWRESGGALDEAKFELAYKYDSGAGPQWALDAFNTVREEREADGKTPIPYTNAQLFTAIGVDYERDGEGRSDPDITFNEAKLMEPQGYDPAQQTLPGIEPRDPSSYLSKQMRDELVKALTDAFEAKAEDDADDIAAPDYLGDSVEEYQQQHWEHSLDDDDRLRHAVDYGLAEIPIEEEDADEEELPLDDPLIEAARDPNPKAIWRIADSPRGKALLLGKDWHGVLDLKDPESMARFNAYVRREKPHAEAAG